MGLSLEGMELEQTEFLSPREGVCGCGCCRSGAPGDVGLGTGSSPSHGRRASARHVVTGLNRLTQLVFVVIPAAGAAVFAAMFLSRVTRALRKRWPTRPFAVAAMAQTSVASRQPWMRELRCAAPIVATPAANAEGGR